MTQGPAGTIWLPRAEEPAGLRLPPAEKGLLRSEPRRGVIVPALTDEDVADISFVREALELAAIRSIIAGGCEAAAYEALDECATAMETAAGAGDWEAVGRFDLDFHTALMASTGSQRLQRMFTTVMSETRLCLGALTGAQGRHDLVAEHRGICEWIRDGDTERALAALAGHFDDAVRGASSKASLG